MRQAFNGKIWKDDSGQLVALNLGADYCAEHEWGIAPIQKKFGIDSSKLGIEGRTITKGSDQVKKVSFEMENWSKSNKNAKRAKVKLYGIVMKNEYAFVSSGEEEKDDFSWVLKPAFWDQERDEIKGYWCDSRFLALVPEEAIIDKLIEAFNQNDVSFWIGGGGPFQNGGLVIAIVSKLDDEFKQSMLDVDQDALDLEKAAKDTGIHEILKKANKHYHTLSPRWADDSKKEIRFWLNPQDGEAYQYGWYSVDELKQWAENSGPIIIKKETAL